MPFFYRNFFLPFIFLYNFYHCLYMTGAGTYDPALGNETSSLAHVTGEHCSHVL